MFGIAHEPTAPYTGAKGFAGQPAARLARLALAYGALMLDHSAPGALRDYAAAALGELRALLATRGGVAS